MAYNFRGGDGVQLLSCIQLFVTPWTTAQGPLSMVFSKEEYWSGLPFPSAGDLSDPGIETAPPEAPALQGDSLLLSHQESLTLSFFHATSFCPIFS